MNIDQVHVPERLPNETPRAYRDRRAMSRRLAGRARLVHAKGQAEAPSAKRVRRLAVKAIGIRQFKIRLRAYRSAEGAAA